MDPDHKGIEGNEIADTLAKRAAKGDSLYLHPFVPSSYLKQCVRTTLERKWNLQWQQSLTGEWTRKFFPTIYSAKLLTASYQIIQVLTGHGRFNDYLFKFNIVNSPNCLCQNSVETVEHFLFFCPIFQPERSEFKSYICTTVKQWPPPLNIIIRNSTAWNKFKNFVFSTKRLLHNR